MAMLLMNHLSAPIFYDFFGENVFKTDISISVPELGSLLDHSGLHKIAEEFIAEVFKADRSYIVTNGTSTANKMVGMYSASEGETILVDRNCHKSICHFMMMTNVIPLYLKPTRNAYGIIGGIKKSEFSQTTIQQKVKNCPIKASQPNYAIITNSTYDGLLYDTSYIQKTLNIAKLHFDGAWIPYACFHPIYQNKHAMCLTPENNQVIFETQSTHKLLAAFSQASMIHIKGNYTEDIMNECFMLHTSTSPLYPIVSSCEVSAAMLKGVRGFNLINGAIERAIAFRNEVKRLKNESKTWYFDVWQPDNIKLKKCWNLNKKDTWHGFKEDDQSHMSLDPIKITILTPGISNNKLDIFGIPASIVSMYLDSHGIIVEKTGPYSMLFLFSFGINKAKSMYLLSCLNNFKTAYDNNLLIKDMLPNLYNSYPESYKSMRIQTLSNKLHLLIKNYDLPNLMYEAFDCLPHMEMTPHFAYQKLIKDETKIIPLDELEGNISAVMVLPYPPGIPLIMPGEKITKKSIVILKYLQMLEKIGTELLGFESDIHGLKLNNEGRLSIRVIK